MTAEEHDRLMEEKSNIAYIDPPEAIRYVGDKLLEEWNKEQ